MDQLTIEQVFANKKSVLERINKIVSELSEESINSNPVSGWSIKDILEHLSIAETQLLNLIKSLLKKAEENINSNLTGTNLISVTPLLNAKATRYKTQEQLNPRGEKTSEESLKDLKEIQDELISLHKRLETVDLSIVDFTHRIFGPLNIGQWLVFIYVHEEKHIEQIIRVCEEIVSLKNH